MDDSAVIVAFIIAFILFIAMLIAGLAAAVNWSNDTSCHSRWTSNFEPAYGWFSGCTIVVNGQRIPSANYRVL